MRNCTTSVLEQGNTRRGNFETEPFEAGWAREAIWFLRLLEPVPPGAFRLKLGPQISPDGLLWCDAPDTEPLIIEGPVGARDVAALRLAHFGNWLRLRVEPDDAALEIKVLIHLVLKE